MVFVQLKGKFSIYSCVEGLGLSAEAPGIYK